MPTRSVSGGIQLIGVSIRCVRFVPWFVTVRRESGGPYPLDAVSRQNVHGFRNFFSEAVRGMLPMWKCCRFQCCRLPMRGHGRRDGHVRGETGFRTVPDFPDRNTGAVCRRPRRPQQSNRVTMSSTPSRRIRQLSLSIGSEGAVDALAAQEFVVAPDALRLLSGKRLGMQHLHLELPRFLAEENRRLFHGFGHCFSFRLACVAHYAASRPEIKPNLSKRGPLGEGTASPGRGAAVSGRRRRARRRPCRET